MIKGSDIKNINMSWLYHMTQTLEEQIEYVFQVCDLRTAANAEQFVMQDEIVIISPMNQWTATPDGMGILVNLQLAVIVRQAPGEILKAFSRIVDIQGIIEQALYGSERLLADSMEAPEFAIPFRSFDENGDPTGIINQEGLRYERGIWADRTPDGELVQSWTTSLQASIY